MNKWFLQENANMNFSDLKFPLKWGKALLLVIKKKARIKTGIRYCIKKKIREKDFIEKSF